MNVGSVIKYAIAAAVGGFTGYLIADYIYSRVDDRHVEDYILELEEEEDDSTDDVELQEVEETWLPEEQPLESKRNRIKQHQPIDYAKISISRKKLKSPEAMVQEIIGSTDGPYVIDDLEYAMRNPAYKTRELTYYEVDDVVVDNDDVVISSPEKLIGPDALLNFGVKSDDPDIVYIRNDQNMTQYEVARVHGSYDEIILGNEPGEKKRKKKTQKKEIE